jgi:FAD/FMN-containing dehydrogenase
MTPKPLAPPTFAPEEKYAVGARIEDWARLVSFQPRLYFRPQNLDELKGFLQIIQQQSLGKPSLGQPSLRVLGGLHSCSDICVSDAILDVSDLPKTLEFSPDLSSVTVSANWHFHEFLEALAAKGKSITATGGTDEQTLAGIISTNTAPATPHHTIYELVDWIEYLTLEPGGAAVERRVHKDEPDFRALIGSLGAVGVITRLHLRLVDQLFFETVQRVIKLSEFLDDIQQTSQTYDFWRIDWIPDTDEGLAWTAQRIPSADELGDYAADQAQNILVAIFTALDKIEDAGAILDMPMRLLYAGLARTYGVVKARGPLRHMLPVDRYSPLHVAMAEWSFDPADLNRLMAACRAYFKQAGWPNMPIEIELTQTDNYDMSPWNWPGLAYIVKLNFMYLTDVITNDGERLAMMAHLKGLWDFLIQAGIPFKAHWGKINFMDPAFVRQNFAFERFEPFIRPLFLNPYLRERLYSPE